jgi:hypothetical protein
MLRTPFALLVAAGLAASAAAASPETRTGFFPSGEAYAPPAAEAPAAVSRAFVRTAVPVNGRVRLEVPVRGGGPLLVWTLAHGSDDPSSARASLRTPGQRTLGAAEAQNADGSLRRFTLEARDAGIDLPGAREAILVTAAEPGLHQLELQVGSKAKAVSVVAAEPESPVTLSAWAGPLSRQPGQPVNLHAVLRDGERALYGARVSARLAAPGQAAGRAVLLHDDGRHGDGAAADGEYAATVDRLAVEAPGLWSARFEATGRDAQGLAFARTGSSGFMSERGTARLGAVRGRVIDGNGERRVVVDAEAAAAAPGRYRLDVIVAGAAANGGRPSLAWGETSDRLQGRSHFSAEIPLPAGSAGPYLLDVRLLGLDAPGVAGRVTLEVGR